jgi:glycosyltransferase involved in cell wall biosynthesis
MQVEVLLPVYNEAESIEPALREIYHVVAPVCSMTFLLCVDGSTDGTTDILNRLTGELPIRLVTSRQRKGYSRAVVDGLREVKAPFVFFLDSDGQIDPTDFPVAFELRDKADVVVGWRANRQDNFVRRCMSRSFLTVYRTLFHIRLTDPSCPFLLIRRDVLRDVLPRLGRLKQGFWWEFIAWVHEFGYQIQEIPVHHRPRLSGQTKVYLPVKIPGIAISHLAGLFAMKLDMVRDAHNTGTPKETT